MQYTRKYYIYIINIHLYTYFFFFFFRRYFWRLISSLSHVIVSCLSCILLEAGNYLINMDHLEKKISIFEIYIYFFYWALGWGYCDFWIFFFFFSIFFFLYISTRKIRKWRFSLLEFIDYLHVKFCSFKMFCELRHVE